MTAPPVGNTPMERKLFAAFALLLEASERAEEIMRSGRCPKCRAEPVDGEGAFDEDFALSMCMTEDWADFQHDVVIARETLLGAELDLNDSPARMLEESLVAIDKRMAGVP